MSARAEADTERAGGIARGVLDLVGRTPLLHLQRYVPAGGASVFAKLEFLNPGGSVKDRAALGMVLAAEEAGLLAPGATIVEPTAGNTGVGLALIGISRGYRVVVVVPEKFVGPKTAVMNVLGAEIVLTPTEAGIEGAIARARGWRGASPGPSCPSSSRTPPTPPSTSAPRRWRSTSSWGTCPRRW
jgi:cysteine synthase